MTDRERFIFEKLNDGYSVGEVAEIIEISPGRVRQVLHHGCRTIRQSLERRYSRMSAEKQKGKESVCGIFSLGEVTYEALKSFDSIVRFLRSKCGTARFEVSADAGHSGFMYVLERYVKLDQILYSSETNPRKAITDMIDHIDFCVCGLSDSPAEDEIREYILQSGQVVLIDINVSRDLRQESYCRKRAEQR